MYATVSPNLTLTQASVHFGFQPMNSFSLFFPQTKSHHWVSTHEFFFHSSFSVPISPLTQIFRSEIGGSLNQAEPFPSPLLQWDLDQDNPTLLKLKPILLQIERKGKKEKLLRQCTCYIPMTDLGALKIVFFLSDTALGGEYRYKN